MRFISNGDYILPLEFTTYWAQHFFTWSYERGAANPDGIMRLPGRLIDLLVFGLFGNVGLGYFYVCSCLVIAFLSFLWFSRSFLSVTRWGTSLLAATFFTLNPIFLGNLSKVGLVLAVAMLPAALTALKRGFETGRLSFFLVAVLALNISLIHPFTFAINTAVVLGYAVYLAHKHGPFVHDNAWKFVLLGVTALLLNAYCVLPLASMRTLDKGSLSDSVATTPVDYTGLVDIANTGDIFTGLSLSKGVLKDYEFYGAMTWPFYFLGVFLFYSLLFGVYVHVEKRLNPHERRRFLVAMGIFLALLVLTTASYLYADVLIKFLIGLPGGWMFRSPLKWQLYMPMVLFTALVIALKYIQGGRRLKLLYASLGLSFLLMNGYLFTQIYTRLLTPKTITHFSALAQIDMKHKNLLVADSGACITIARDKPEVNTELNQVLLSKQAQVKHAQAGKLDEIHLGQYDYVLGCAGTLDRTLLTEQFAFAPAATLADGAYELYKNRQPVPYASAASQLFAVPSPKNLGGLYWLANNRLKQPLVFAPDNNRIPSTGVQDIFGDISPEHMKDGAIQVSLTPITAGHQKVFVAEADGLQYTQEAERLTFQSGASQGSPVDDREPLAVHIPAGQKMTFVYRDPAFSYHNVVPNPSLEEDLWQTTVGDCNNYDDNASLGMAWDASTATKGKKSLKLTAENHIACTGPTDMSLDAGANYLLSFDYRSSDGRDAGYYVGFDDPEQTVGGARLDATHGQWQRANTIISVPEGAAKARLLVYAFPNSASGQPGTAHYDNFNLVKIPAISNRFFLVSDTQSSSTSAPRVEFEKSDPTRSIMQIRGAKENFFLSTKESYHHLWQLHPGNSRQVLPNHLRLNGNMSGWYIEPETLCRQPGNLCSRAADGSYTFGLVMEFAPQRWFYIGIVISGITFVAVVLYAAYDLWRGRPSRKGTRR